MNRRFSLVLGLCAIALGAIPAGAETIAVATGYLEASSHDDEELFAESLVRAIELASQQSEAIEFRGRGSASPPRIDVTATNLPDSRFISLSFAGVGGESAALLIRAPWDDLLPRLLTQGLRYFEPMVTGYPTATEDDVLFEDSFPLESVRPPSVNLGMVGLYPTGLARNVDGGVILSGTTFAVSIDSLFRITGYPGADLLDQGVMNYARSVAVTPAGTVYFQPAQGSEVYRLIPGAPRTQRIRGGVGGFGPFTVLPDGTVITIDAVSKRAAALEGRERREIDLFPNPDAYISAATTGPAGNIWIFDGAEQRISIVTPDGRVVDTIIPAVPQAVGSQTVGIAPYPDGSFLLLTRAGLWKIRRDGRPIWGYDELPSTANTSFQLMVAVATDPENGLIYLADSGSRSLIRLREAPIPDDDAAFRGEGSVAAEIRRINRSLAATPEEPELIFEKAAIYEEIGAVVLAGSGYQHVLDLDPFNDEAAQGLERIEVLKLTEGALRLAAEAEKQLRTVGPATAMRSYNEALRSFEQILAMRPDNEQVRREMQALQEAFSEGSTTGGEPSPLRIDELAMENLFPGLFSAYRSRPVGTVSLTNRGDEELTAVRVSGELRRYTDFATETDYPESIPPGGSVEIPFRLLLNSEVFEVEEDLPLQARISITGEAAGRTVAAEGTVGFTLYRRTALNWSETERLAGFITPNEGNVSRFALTAANRVTEVVGDREPTERDGVSGFPRIVERAGAIADALGLHRVAYVEDPETPISAILMRNDVVDTVRLPRTTLLNRAGDCDDTTALLCSLYEAAGIGTAIVTTPDHVLMAFDTGEDAANRWLYEAARLNPFEVEGTLWLPVETTVLSQGFDVALDAAARRIGAAGGIGEAGFVTASAARESYPTIPLPATELNIPNPSAESLRGAHRRSFATLKERFYDAGVTRLEGAIEEAEGRGKVSLLGRLGALHHRFGESRRAETALRDAIALDADAMVPLVNLATLYITESRPARAVELLEPAQEQRPRALLLNALLARAHLDLGNVEKGRSYAELVEERSPELAGRYGISASDGSLRAAGELDRSSFPLLGDEDGFR